mmetsp:Transcript_70504/g.217808  ORF Transcript_70504/g.217808 Transcript_70504/m.217808 type:complete len:438 (-) Transcript_70504:368-1681(-)
MQEPQAPRAAAAAAGRGVREMAGRRRPLQHRRGLRREVRPPRRPEGRRRRIRATPRAAGRRGRQWLRDRNGLHQGGGGRAGLASAEPGPQSAGVAFQGLHARLRGDGLGTAAPHPLDLQAQLTCAVDKAVLKASAPPLELLEGRQGRLQLEFQAHLVAHSLIHLLLQPTALRVEAAQLCAEFLQGRLAGAVSVADLLTPGLVSSAPLLEVCNAPSHGPDLGLGARVGALRGGDLGAQLREPQARGLDGQLFLVLQLLLAAVAVAEPLDLELFPANRRTELLTIAPTLLELDAEGGDLVLPARPPRSLLSELALAGLAAPALLLDPVAEFLQVGPRTGEALICCEELLASLPRLGARSVCAGALLPHSLLQAGHFAHCALRSLRHTPQLLGQPRAPGLRRAQRRLELRALVAELPDLAHAPLQRLCRPRLACPLLLAA